MDYPSKTIYLTFWLTGAIIGTLFSITVDWITTHNPFHSISSECLGITELDEIYDTCKTLWSEAGRLLFLFSLMFLPWLVTSLLACGFKLTSTCRTTALLLICALVTMYLPLMTTLSNITAQLGIITLLLGIPLLINLSVLLFVIIATLPEQKERT